MNSDTIFFSYSRLDAIEFALKLYYDLQNCHADVWIDQVNIGKGKRWDREIENTINNCSSVLFIMSQASVSSDHVLDEVYYALNKGKQVIPISFDKCEVPYRIQRLQAIHFENNYAAGFKDLLKALKIPDCVSIQGEQGIIAKRPYQNPEKKNKTSDFSDLENKPITNTRYKRFLVLVGTFLLIGIAIFILFSNILNKKESRVHLTNDIDPDIVLINIQNYGRTEIGTCLLKLNQYHPITIALNVYFPQPKDQFGDSVFVNALNSIQNEVLLGGFDGNSKSMQFDQFNSEIGFSAFHDSTFSNMVPLPVFGNFTTESFPLKIIKQWKPNFKCDIKANESIPIHYTRTLNQFVQFNMDEILENRIDSAALYNKVILVGYLGPDYEDKHYTPIRTVLKNKDLGPDTYGLVIIANAIRTILNKEK